jgi:hypothetical protein
MTDTGATRKVAQAQREPGDSLKIGRNNANAFVKPVGAQANLLNALGGSHSHRIDGIYELCYEELADLGGHAVETLEGGAAFAAAIFGPETIPETDDREMASRARLAFRVAKVVLVSSESFDAFFLACAVAVQRVEGKRVDKRFAKTMKAKRKQAG